MLSEDFEGDIEEDCRFFKVQVFQEPAEGVECGGWVFHVVEDDGSVELRR